MQHLHYLPQYTQPRYSYSILIIHKLPHLHVGRQMDSEDKRPKLEQGKENAEEYVVMFYVNFL